MRRSPKRKTWCARNAVRRFVVVGVAAGILDAVGFKMSYASAKPVHGELAQAVAEQDIEKVRALLQNGADPNDCDERGVQALLIATATDQFRVANLLLDHKADIWVSRKLGFTPGDYAVERRMREGSVEDVARQEFIRRLRLAGYPWPPPSPDEVVELRRTGRWPPVARHQSD